jgi:fluoroquinolone transport system permease protein
VTGLPRQVGRVWRLTVSDVLATLRDPVLVIAATMSLVPPLLFALWGEQIVAFGAGQLGVPDLRRLLAPSALLLPASLIGWVVGFLVLEDRDEGTLLALSVTPVGKGGVLGFRLAAAGGLSALLAAATLPFVLPGLDPLRVLAVLVLVGLAGVLATVILPALARNKVEGLALTKISNLVILVPLAALLPAPFRYLFGWLPSYWLGELLFVEAGPIAASLMVAAGVVLHLCAIGLLVRRFLNRSG